MALPTRVPDAATATDIGKMPIEGRIRYVVEHAAAQLPASVGRQLLTLIEPKSLAIVGGVVTVWTGAQFFGVGEIADVVLLVGGYAMLGAVAFEAARLISQCGALTVRAKSEDDLVNAGAMLARAVTLIGVQGTLAILLDRPTDALKVQRFADRANPNPLPITAFKNLPSNRWWGYVPAVKADTEDRMFAGEGATSPITGDIKILPKRDVD